MIPASHEYPLDSIQRFFTSETSQWWERKAMGNGEVPGRWDLLVSLVPHLGDVPHRAHLTRVEAEDHGRLQAEVTAFHIDRHKPKPETDLPAAAFPDGAFIYGGKVRPVLVVSHVHPSPSRATRGSARSVTKPSFLVAPYYGADPDGARAGFPHEFVSRIRQAFYSQFFWDQLPSGLPHIKHTECSSILRLDQVFPIYRKREEDVAAWTPTGWTLSSDARKIIDEWIRWGFQGGVKSGGVIDIFRSILKEEEGEQPA